MADLKDLSSNPFSALFGSVNQAQEFSQAVTKEKKEKDEEKEPITSAVTEENLQQLALQKLEINQIIENVFLICLDSEQSHDTDRPSRCVFMEELFTSLEGQTWLDMECIDQAVFERSLMENPGNHVIRTSDRPTEDPGAASLAGESLVLRYFYQCYCRYKAIQNDKKHQKYNTELMKCNEIILMNAKNCLQQSELYPGQNTQKQLLKLCEEETVYLSSGTETIVEFLDKVIQEIQLHQEDGSLEQVMKPIFLMIGDRFMKEFTLMNPGFSHNVDLLSMFVKHPALAEVFLDSSAPVDWTNGKAFERTILGSMMSLSCTPKTDLGPYEFFENPSSKTKQDIDAIETSVQQPIANNAEKIYQFLFKMVKLSPDIRHKVMNWLGKCIAANSGRSKIWSAQMPQLFHQMYCSEGFGLNLCHIMLKFCKPFSEPNSTKLLKIQCSYPSVVPKDENHSKQIGVHSGGMNKETCLVPSAENEKLPEEDSYNFITECFFLTHQCINMSFHTVHEKFVKLNQELHRIQRLYQEVRSQGSDEVEPVRSIKLQMEKGMTLYLCMKAALTEPVLLELCLNFYLATATWLVQTAVVDNPKSFTQIKLPLPETIPKSLAHIPEFIMGNLTDFTLFLQRFKDDLYEVAGHRLEHFMTLILVFMGSPDRMRNPHLRAELAETLAALMPGDPQRGGQGLLSRYHREILFTNHRLIEHLARTLLHVFVSIEMTGQSVEFEQKFNYRRPMYMVLEYIWEIEFHRDAVKKLAEEAESKIEATDAPLFLRFINLLINDGIFLLDEALDFMSQIKEKQEQKDGGGWNQMDQQQRQEAESTLRQISMLARYHNVMANYTIHALDLLTRDIKSIFCHCSMVDRIAGMLNYFLLHLVGPKQKNFKVKDKNEYEFKPQQIVSDICQIYQNLGESEEFCIAVSSDGRSYSKDLFPKAINVLQKINRSPTVIDDFRELDEKIKKISQKCEEEEELYSNAPEEFLDPIMGTLMKEPVLLPSSKNIVDKSVIARHILSDQSDPFNRSPLSLDMVIPQHELKEKIHKWIAETRNKR